MSELEEIKCFEIQNGEIGFPELNYWIELSRIRTKDDLVEWVYHLSGKTWVNTDMVAEFIEKVCKYRHWKIYVEE